MAVGLAKLGAHLHPARAVAPSSSPQAQADVQAYLDSLHPKLGGLTSQFHSPVGSYQEVISQLAKDQKCFLVVMYSHKRADAARHVLGSGARAGDYCSR